MSLLTKKQIIEDVKKVIQESGNTSGKHYYKTGKHSESTILKKFGNWSSLLKELGIEPEIKRNIPKEAIVEDVMRVFEETNNTTRENYLVYGNFSRAPIKRLFGNWNNLLKELNQTINMHKNVSESEVLVDVMRIHEKYGYITAELYRKEGNFSQPVIDRLFGAFSDLMRMLSWKVDGRHISDEEVVNSIVDLYNEFGFISSQLINEHAPVSHATVCNRFGSLYDLCEQLNIPLYQEEDLSKLARFVISVLNECITEDAVFEKTFDWLVNPYSNKNLFIDVYYKNLNLAVEVDGDQHNSKRSFYHATQEDFEIYKFRDELKNKLLSEHGINLVRILPSDKRQDIITKIKPYLPIGQVISA